jgi:hypothetical protein
MKAFWSYVTAGVGFAMLVTIVLLATGWGSAAASAVGNVFVTNTSANPVPIAATGTVPVHEQGTANVNVTNTTSMPVTAKNLNTDTNGNLKVAEQGTPNVNVQNFPSSQTVSGNVSVSNFPAGATTAEITAGGLTVAWPGGFELFTDYKDISAYREVTLYLYLTDPDLPPPAGLDAAPPPSPGFRCAVSTKLSSGPTITFDAFETGGGVFNVTKTYDPAPPNIQISCINLTGDHINVTYMLAGRTG